MQFHQRFRLENFKLNVYKNYLMIDEQPFEGILVLIFEMASPRVLNDFNCTRVVRGKLFSTKYLHCSVSNNSIVFPSNYKAAAFSTIWSKIQWIANTCAGSSRRYLVLCSVWIPLQWVTGVKITLVKMGRDGDVNCHYCHRGRIEENLLQKVIDTFDETLALMLW